MLDTLPFNAMATKSFCFASEVHGPMAALATFPLNSLSMLVGPGEIG